MRVLRRGQGRSQRLGWVVRSLLAAALVGTHARAQGGVLWLRASAAHAPSPRRQHALAFDRTRATTLLFGGVESGSGNAGLRGDTWEWDGGDWRQRLPVTAPPARFGHAMAHDPDRDVVVLFGGVDALESPLADTWTWDGTTWTMVSPAHAPPARAGHAMAYDAARQRLLLFGGTDALGLLDDTWLWDGGDWTRVTPTVSPPGRYQPAMAYDAVRRNVVLFGGDDSVTWLWDGDWHMCASFLPPPDRRGPALAWDAARQRVVLFGGVHGGYFTFEDTWEWDGAQWTEVTPAVGPAPRWLHAMAYDAVRRRTVLFGGQSGTTVFPDTWECVSIAPAEVTAFGSGCPGSLGEPTLNATSTSSAWIGDDLHLVLDHLPPGSGAFLLLGRSVSRTSWPQLPGCTLWTSPLVALPLVRTGDTAPWLQTIPFDPGLVGRPLYLQGLALAAGGANPLGAAFSHAVMLTLGMR